MLECTRPILSLFSGAGGLDLGFKEAGFSPQLAIDADAAAVATYKRNHQATRAEQRDLALLSPDELLELWESSSNRPPVGVIGGPPCQSFSVSNPNVRADDPRSILPACYAKLLAALNSAYCLQFFVFENVRGLQAVRNRPAYQRFLTLFEAAGFRLFEAVLDARHFGVAQQRKRLLIVGLNADVYPLAMFSFPGSAAPVEQRTVRSEIMGLPEPTYFHRDLQASQIPVHPNHWTMVPRSPKFADPMQRLNWSRGRSFRVLRWDMPSWTVAYGHREVHVHPEGHRRLSVYEALLLQGFPHSYVLEGTLSQQFRQVGDAVPPPMARALAEAISAFLEAHQTDPPPSAVADSHQSSV